MTTRDDFTPKIKRIVALRAGYLCSFTGCNQLTVGPSYESSSAVTNVGVAAHIHAAASGIGARRYLESMTSQERASIDNAIWMCATHAVLIDRDEVKYTADLLRKMKKDHELMIEKKISVSNKSIGLSLIGLGTEIIATGEVIGSDGVEWIVKIENFVLGDVNSLIIMSEHFNALSKDERYVLINEIGDGRVLSSAPKWKKESGFIVLFLMVCQRARRNFAQHLKTDLKLVDGDISVKNGMIETVSGVDSLSQKIQMCLGVQQGEIWFSKKIGSRIKEYFLWFGSSIWFEQMAKLEFIRLASIPYENDLEGFSPLWCVECVKSIQVINSKSESGIIYFDVKLDVRGVGDWEAEIPFLMG